ncbi:uncharacterized protein LOC133881423 isoform X2 [Alnus glutinosa]|uniref:uncharacterized protein LOC133881423 isoform X2 n=1 Tax=Alnus glutinosa TaxID=3517 RepID=UPI002D7828B8|nr:uncharacterized protein LOC133881423 isoform X2 [Alnus glutinosa]
MAVVTFISSLPIRKIGGIGKVTEHILRDVFGINTCGGMLQKGGFICALFSRSTAGDSSRKSNSDNSSLGSIVDSHEICSYEDRDLLDDNHLPDLEDNHTISNNAGGVEKTYEPFKNGNCKQESHLLWSLHVAAYMNEVNRRANLLDDEAVSSSNQEELLLWVNDYK